MAADDIDRLEDIARDALATGDEESALAQLAPAAEKASSARLWQFTGLLQRSLDRHSDALRSFVAAAQLAPEDASIAHGLARVALEAGIDAVAMFERAVKLSPGSGPVVLGLVAAKQAAGRGAEAEGQLDALLERSPSWVEGHTQLAQLRSLLGKRDQAFASIERALIKQPGDPNLWAGMLNLMLTQNQFEALDEAVARARQAKLPDSLVMPFEAVAAAELGQSDRAERLFQAMSPEVGSSIGGWRVRHLLRTGQIEHAIALIDREIEGEGAALFWPYASVAWRLAGDPRFEWLEADGKLVSEVDLTDELPSLDAIAIMLRSLHVRAGEYLDQSVRGGTQTDGPLFSRIEPEIQALRAAIVGAIEVYRAQLPVIDPAHPLLRERRDRRIRFAGSWSVRLRGSGYHVSHVHPQGWLSSAFYMSLPESGPSEPHAGWLKIGEPPPSLGVDLPPSKLIKPQAGRLVLFPSWMWHGTVPFPAGERLTVAFDVRRPS
jgi:tetratricopeptide (TPR) repeat protein